MKKAFAFLLFSVVVLSCTDLDAPVYDKVGTFWQTPLQIQQGMAHAYVQLRNYVPTFFIVPTFMIYMKRAQMKL